MATTLRIADIPSYTGKVSGSRYHILQLCDQGEFVSTYLARRVLPGDFVHKDGANSNNNNYDYTTEARPQDLFLAKVVRHDNSAIPLKVREAHVEERRAQCALLGGNDRQQVLETNPEGSSSHCQPLSELSLLCPTLLRFVEEADPAPMGPDKVLLTHEHIQVSICEGSLYQHAAPSAPKITADPCSLNTLIRINTMIAETTSHNGDFTEDDAVRMMVQVALAIRVLHLKRLMHRDIRSAGVDVFRSGLVKLCEPATAHLTTHASFDPNAPRFVGLPDHIAPEILFRRCGVGDLNSFPGDIFSLGVLCYEIIARVRPFRRTFAYASFDALRRADISPFPQRCSEELRTIITQMLALEPDRRPNIFEVLQSSVFRDGLAKLEQYLHSGSFLKPPIPREDRIVLLRDIDEVLRRGDTEQLTKWYLHDRRNGELEGCVQKMSFGKSDEKKNSTNSHEVVTAKNRYLVLKDGKISIFLAKPGLLSVTNSVQEQQQKMRKSGEEQGGSEDNEPLPQKEQEQEKSKTTEITTFLFARPDPDFGPTAFALHPVDNYNRTMSFKAPSVEAMEAWVDVVNRALKVMC